MSRSPRQEPATHKKLLKNKTKAHTTFYLCGPECCYYGSGEVKVGPGDEHVADGRGNKNGIDQGVNGLQMKKKSFHLGACLLSKNNIMSRNGLSYNGIMG